MLWAGADPLAPALCDPDELPVERDDAISAVEYACLYNHFELLGNKKMIPDPNHPSVRGALRWASSEPGLELLERLLKAGLRVNDLPDGSSSLFEGYLGSIGNRRALSPLVCDLARASKGYAGGKKPVEGGADTRGTRGEMDPRRPTRGRAIEEIVPQP